MRIPWLKNQQAKTRIGVFVSKQRIDICVLSANKTAILLLDSTPLAEITELGAIFGAQLRKHALADCECYFVLSNQFYNLLQIDKPKVPDDEISSTLPFIAKEYINEPIDSVVFDYFSVPSQAKPKQDKPGLLCKNDSTNSANIQGKVTRVGPDSGGVDGLFQYANDQPVKAPLKTPDWSTLTGFTYFKKGVSAFTQAKYNEVGIIKFDLQDEDYHGRPIEVAGDGITIGRFTPDHFTLVKSESSVTNYLTTPEGVGVTYMSQPALVFNYKLQAQNLDGKVTRNYIGDYNKAEIATLAKDKVSFAAESDSVNASIRLADFSGSWCNGVYQSGSCTQYGGDIGQFRRLITCLPRQSKNCPDGPFMNSYFGIKLEDTDEVKINELDMLPASSAKSTAKRLSQKKSELRYGRWTIADGYGPINQPFPVTMQLEYFNDKKFVLNKDDSTTAFSASAATATFDYKNKGINLKPTGNGTFQDGFTQTLIIHAHSHIGDVRLKHTAPIWLQYDGSSAGDAAATDDNPAATISFGFFRGNDRVIYRRRVH
ncbi:MAG: hypothetical protein ACI86X_000291 [Moritella sp.]|jgi:hypothetical protein